MESENIDNSLLVKRSKEWEKLMSKYQKPILKDNGKWELMEKIFEL
ncbi:MAG: hypothetical protein HC906_18140 [Bacteroidales bacterium]|nr:hypothetical protein [Bacteroidales bacterium]